MKLNTQKLAEDTANFILDGVDPQWHLEPIFINGHKAAILEDIEMSIKWCMFDEQGDDKFGLRDTFLQKHILIANLKRVWDVALSDVLEFNDTPSADTLIVVIRQYIQAIVTEEAAKLGVKDQLPPDVRCDGTLSLLVAKHAGAVEFLYNISEMGYRKALEKLNEFKLQQVSSNVAEMMNDGTLQGVKMLTDDWEPEMDIDFDGGSENDVDIDVTNREMDDVLDPRDPDVRKTVEQERAEEERQLELKAKAQRVKIEETKRINKAIEKAQESKSQNKPKKKRLTAAEKRRQKIGKSSFNEDDFDFLI